MKTSHQPPNSSTTFRPVIQAHLLACFESQLLQGSHRQSLILRQRSNELGSGSCHLLQHSHHPCQVFPAVKECVGHLCNRPESRAAMGPIPQLLTTSKPFLSHPDPDPDILSSSWFYSASFPPPRCPKPVVQRPEPLGSQEHLSLAFAFESSCKTGGCHCTMFPGPGAGGQYLKPPAHPTQGIGSG